MARTHGATIVIMSAFWSSTEITHSQNIHTGLSDCAFQFAKACLHSILGVYSKLMLMVVLRLALLLGFLQSSILSHVESQTDLRRLD
jgi:hypothetical protein